MQDRDYTDRPSPSDIDLMQMLMEAVEGCVVDTVSYVNHAIMEVKYELTTRNLGHKSDESRELHEILKLIRQGRENAAQISRRRTQTLAQGLVDYHKLSDEKDGLGPHAGSADLFGSVEEIFKDFKEEEDK